MKSNVTRFERGQIWVYDDHKDKTDKKTCNNEKGVLIGRRPVLILSVNDNIAIVIKGSRRRRQEKSHIEYNDGTGIGIFDTLQLDRINLDSADMQYSAKIDSATIQDIHASINNWLFTYIDDYNEHGLSKYLKRQIWEYSNNGIISKCIIIKRFKKSVIIVPIEKIQRMPCDIKITTYTTTMYTDITSVHTISTDQLKRYNYTLSEEMYSPIITMVSRYLNGDASISKNDIERDQIRQKTDSVSRCDKKYKNPIKGKRKKSKYRHYDDIDSSDDFSNKEKDISKDFVICPKVFKKLSFDEMKTEFSSNSIQELSKKYGVSVSTIRRGKRYLTIKENELGILRTMS